MISVSVHESIVFLFGFWFYLIVLVDKVTRKKKQSESLLILSPSLRLSILLSFPWFTSLCFPTLYSCSSKINTKQKTVEMTLNPVTFFPFSYDFVFSLVYESIISVLVYESILSLSGFVLVGKKKDNLENLISTFSSFSILLSSWFSSLRFLFWFLSLWFLFLFVNL